MPELIATLILATVGGLIAWVAHRKAVSRETEDWLRKHRCHPDDLDDTIPPDGRAHTCMCDAAAMRACRDEPQGLRPPFCRLGP